MSNVTFPVLPGLMWDVTKTPQWNTRIQKSVGGKEVRTSFYALPIWRWVLKYEVLRQATAFAEFQALADFFNARQGSFDSFLYSDPTDSVIDDSSPATRQNFGTGDGATTAFQLGRRLVIAGGFLDPVYNLNGTPKIYKANTLLTVTTDYTVSASGLVTFTSAPAAAAALTWSGSYYFRCRFDQDSAEFTNFLSQLWEAKTLSFVSVKGS